MLCCVLAAVIKIFFCLSLSSFLVGTPLLFVSLSFLLFLIIISQFSTSFKGQRKPQPTTPDVGEASQERGIIVPFLGTTVPPLCYRHHLFDSFIPYPPRWSSIGSFNSSSFVIIIDLFVNDPFLKYTCFLVLFKPFWSFLHACVVCILYIIYYVPSSSLFINVFFLISYVCFCFHVTRSCYLWCVLF